MWHVLRAKEHVVYIKNSTYIFIKLELGLQIYLIPTVKAYVVHTENLWNTYMQYHHIVILLTKLRELLEHQHEK